MDQQQSLKSLSLRMKVELKGNNVYFIKTIQGNVIKLFVPMDIVQESLEFKQDLKNVSTAKDSEKNVLQKENWKVNLISFRGERYLGYVTQQNDLKR